MRQLSNLKKYKYSSGELGVLDKVLTPFWNWFLEWCIPEWMAPNVITLIGFVFAIIGTFMYLPHDWTLTQPFPSGYYYISAAVVWIYMTMDAVDGKQARRTGTSSPLG